METQVILDDKAILAKMAYLDCPVQLEQLETVAPVVFRDAMAQLVLQ